MTEPATGRTLVCNERFDEWRRETPPLLHLVLLGMEVAVLPDDDGPGGNGATLYWFDGVINEWAEWFSDLPTAMARLAALIRAVESGEFFRDSAEGFTRWSEQFFERTVLTTPIPTPKEGTP